MRPRKLNLNRRLREISFVHRKMSFSEHFPLMRLIEFSFAESVKQEEMEREMRLEEGDMPFVWRIKI